MDIMPFGDKRTYAGQFALTKVAKRKKVGLSVKHRCYLLIVCLARVFHVYRCGNIDLLMRTRRHHANMSVK